jgi:hypothetical protein
MRWSNKRAPKCGSNRTTAAGRAGPGAGRGRRPRLTFRPLRSCTGVGTMTAHPSRRPPPNRPHPSRLSRERPRITSFNTDPPSPPPPPQADRARPTPSPSWRRQPTAPPLSSCPSPRWVLQAPQGMGGGGRGASAAQGGGQGGARLLGGGTGLPRLYGAHECRPVQRVRQGRAAGPGRAGVAGRFESGGDPTGRVGRPVQPRLSLSISLRFSSAPPRYGLSRSCLMTRLGEFHLGPARTARSGTNGPARPSRCDPASAHRFQVARLTARRAWRRRQVLPPRPAASPPPPATDGSPQLEVGHLYQVVRAVTVRVRLEARLVLAKAQLGNMVKSAGPSATRRCGQIGRSKKKLSSKRGQRRSGTLPHSANARARVPACESAGPPEPARGVCAWKREGG